MHAHARLEEEVHGGRHYIHTGTPQRTGHNLYFILTAPIRFPSPFPHLRDGECLEMNLEKMNAPCSTGTVHHLLININVDEKMNV